MHILVTGAAGFIGSHLSQRLIAEGHCVTGLDNLDPFYSVALKRRNLAEIALSGDQFRFIEADLRDDHALDEALQGVDVVVHLAAMAGVRPSIERPLAYVDVNLAGTVHLLEAMRRHDVRRLVFASSSSVYGDQRKVPFSEDDSVDRPISPYAASKKAGELICHTWHHLYGLTVACLRFFTVYGPRQRPDLAIAKFTALIDHGDEIPFFGDGTTSRDYTFVDDTVAGVSSAVGWTGAETPQYAIFNLGNSSPVPLSHLVELISRAVDKPAILKHFPVQPGDVETTYADTRKAAAALAYAPKISIEEGISRYVSWYRALEAGTGRT